MERLDVARAALIAVLATGCLGPDAADCPGGGVCPAGFACRSDNGEQTCVVETCGDGVVDGAESCDDGNNDSGDSCPGDCVAVPRCGDGVVDSDEECDDGNRASGDGCQATCRLPIRPLPRFGMATAYDRRREMLVVFGGAGDEVYGDTWEWNGTEWFERHPSPPLPSPRVNAAMTYDPVRQRVFMFGGSATTNLVSDVMWEWDGIAWHELDPMPAPSMRWATSITFDTARGVAVLFGGQTTEGSSDELWEWNGSTWEPKIVATPMRPAARAGAAVAFDESEGQTLILGAGVGLDNDRMWMWNGASWSSLESPETPGESSGVGMAYDRERDATLLFGGSTSTSISASDRMFERLGTVWMERSDVSVRPPPRKSQGTAYVDAIHAIIVFGGLGPPDPDQTALDDLWSWDGTTWRQHL